MSFRNVQQNSLENVDTLSVPVELPRTFSNGLWFRNPTWPALPSITASEEKLVGLYAVYPNSGLAAVNFTVNSGLYRVDWGDGTAAQTYTSATQANYTYDYNAAGLANTNGPVTFTDATDTVNRVAHGYVNDQPISFDSITTTTGITASQIYYVINAAADTFQLAATPGGSVLPLTNDGSGIILPYKIATITITPNTGGSTFTTFNLDLRNSVTITDYQTGWLDIAVASSATGMQFSNNSDITTRLRNLEQVRILRHRSTNLNNLFGRLSKLQNVVEITAAAGINVTTMSALFTNCTNLTTIPVINTSSCTSLSQMFQSCTNLVTVPMLNTSACQNMSSMFSDCRSLTDVPSFNTVNVTNMNGMFASCLSLEKAPFLNTSSVTDMSSMFNSCFKLTSVPLYNTANVTNMTSMFTNARTLISIPLYNTANVTNMTSMFTGCTGLRSIPLLNTANVTNMSAMFQSCTGLRSIPLLNTIKVTNMGSMFQSSSSLYTIPQFNTVAVTDMSSMFQGCTNLVSMPLLNTANVTNMGSMFQGCSNLVSIPQFDTAKVTSMGAIIADCTNIQSIPLLNTANVTNMSVAFANARNLQQIPALNFQSATNIAYGTTASLSKLSIINVGISISVANAKLSGAALNEIYTNLLTVQPATTAVTFQGTPDTVTLNNHGYTNGRIISFATIVTTTGISINTFYYVRNATTNTFQLSTTPTGSIINLVNDGTGTLNGQTITVTNNWGTATDTPSIATAKGWTVTGS